MDPLSWISNSGTVTARVPGLDGAGCLGLSLKWWRYLSTISPARLYLTGLIRAGWGELAATCPARPGPRYLGRLRISGADYVAPGTNQGTGPGGQGSPGDPSSSRFQCCDLGTLSLCSLPNFVAEPATTSFGVTGCSQPLTACSRPKAHSHHNPSAHPPCPAISPSQGQTSARQTVSDDCKPHWSSCLSRTASQPANEARRRILS